MLTLRNLYCRIFDAETRKWLYKLRNPSHFSRLRTIVNPSEKGNFSLRAFDEHKCIFVHITKSAGTSVALALFGELPYHHTARDYRIIFGRRDFNRYFKFAFVRNPWDRLYSAFSYLKGGGWNDNDRQWAGTHLAAFDDFEAFVMRGLDQHMLGAHVHFKPQLEFVADRHGRPLIDYVLYFETIRDDFAKISDMIGLNATLEHRNSSKRQGYRDVYTSAMIGKVASLYAADIERFGYSFDGDIRRQSVANGQWVHR